MTKDINLNPAVHLKSVPSYDTALVEEAVEALFSALPAAKRIDETTKILLKPNLLAKHPPAHAVTTHPAVLQAVIHACKRRGATAQNITVADSAGGLYNPAQMKALYQGTGLAAICEAEGVTAYSACHAFPRSVENGVVVGEFDILEPIIEADFIINLPKFKTHVMTGMTVACKNMFGAVPGLKKSDFHLRFPDKERFGEMLLDLLSIVTPDMNIVDGILAMEGDGPAGGSPRTLGLLMASENPIQLDLAVAQMMGLSPMDVPYLSAAHHRGLCGDSFDASLSRGDTHLLSPIANWVLPKSYQEESRGSTDFSNHAPKLLQPLAKKLTHRLASHPVVEGKKCIGCGKCGEICSKNAILIQNKRAKIQQSLCIRCFCCHEVCPVKAIDVRSSRLFGL